MTSIGAVLQVVSMKIGRARIIKTAENYLALLL